MTECVKIKCDDCKFVEDCVDYGWQECKKFTPKPTEPMTNEGWFCGLSTEEKAKEIYKIAKDDFKELRKLFYGVANDDCDAVALWLKQPHKGDNGLHGLD